jgi:hypothetical protein
LCHAHEDAAFAHALSRGIRENGINVWLDKDDLRGGDRWDDAIERTLADVQYVVVLQSKSLRAKDVGYVNKEINLAIERQAYYRRPRIFLIPAIIDSPDSQIDDLKSLQSVDLSAPDGVNELVRTIRRDVDIAGRDSVGQQ